MSSPSKPSTYNGKKIAPIKDGCILGASKAKEIITALNSLLFWKVKTVDGQTGKVVIDDRGTVLEIPRGGISSGTTVSSWPIMMLVVSYHQSAYGDYLVCTPPGGSGNVNVAVEPHLQSGIVTQTMPNGDEWFFTEYTDDIDTDPQQRTSTKDMTVLTEYISPPFLDTDIVPVWPCSNTGVKVDGASITLVALTGRQWASA